MSRAKTKKLYRWIKSPEGQAWAARERGEIERRLERNEIAAAQVVRARRLPPGKYGPVFHCNHSVPWTECTTCSKPRVSP